MNYHQFFFSFFFENGMQKNSRQTRTHEIFHLYNQKSVYWYHSLQSFILGIEFFFPSHFFPFLRFFSLYPDENRSRTSARIRLAVFRILFLLFHGLLFLLFPALSFSLSLDFFLPLYFSPQFLFLFSSFFFLSFPFFSFFSLFHSACWFFCVSPMVHHPSALSVTR